MSASDVYLISLTSTGLLFPQRVEWTRAPARFMAGVYTVDVQRMHGGRRGVPRRQQRERPNVSVESRFDSCTPYCNLERDMHRISRMYLDFACYALLGAWPWMSKGF